MLFLHITPSTTVRHNIRHDIRHERPLNIREQTIVARHTQDSHVHSAGVGLIRILRYPWLDNEAFYNNTSSSTWSKYESIAPISETTSQREHLDYVRSTRFAS